MRGGIMQKQKQIRCSKIASLFALAMLAIVTAVPAARAQNTIGTISQLQGTANIQRNGATIAAMPNLPLLVHDKVATDANSAMTIAMVDNSSLILGPSTTMTIDESVLVNGIGAPSKVGLLGGHLHSLIVGAMRGSSTTFQVNTPNAIGAVRGTEWDTQYDEDEHEGSKGCRKRTRVDVEDGTVLFCNTANPPQCRDVHQGKHSEIRCGAFWEGSAGLGALGATALGVGLAAGVGVGVAAGAGGFSGPGGSSTPATGSK
jgi:hypothetical protein